MLRAVGFTGTPLGVVRLSQSGAAACNEDSSQHAGDIRTQFHGDFQFGRSSAGSGDLTLVSAGVGARIGKYPRWPQVQ